LWCLDDVMFLRMMVLWNNFFFKSLMSYGCFPKFIAAPFWFG
jgi:hypothetical protein